MTIKRQHPSYPQQLPRRKCTAFFIGTALMVLPLPTLCAEEQRHQEAVEAGITSQKEPATPKLTPEQEQFLARFTPEVRAKLLTLPPAILSRMGSKEKASGRPAHKFEERFTARQVMQQLLSDYQSIGSALAMDNGTQAAENARHLIDHPSPVGHLYPYVSLDRITGENFGAIPAMYDAVFGNAGRLAQAADAGDLAKAAQLYGDIFQGCMACHRLFRGTPGLSPNLLPIAPAKESGN